MASRGATQLAAGRGQGRIRTAPGGAGINPNASDYMSKVIGVWPGSR